MRYLRATATGSLAVLMLAAATLGPRAQVMPLAVEKDPPLATRPVAPAPVLVPQPSGPPIPAQPPTVAAPPVVPQGPGPVTVPSPPKPGPVFVPATPPIQGGSAPQGPAEVKPAPAPAPKIDAAEPTPPPATAPAPEATPAPVPGPGPGPAPTAEAPPAPTPPPAAAIEEVTVEARPVLFVTGVTTWEKSEAEMNRAFATLAKAAEKLGLSDPAGPLVEYIESDSDDVGYRVMLPVAAPPKGKLPKGVKLGTSPTGKALKFRHDGPIDDLEEVYARIDDEVTKRGVDARGIVEEYDADALTSPEDRVVVDVFVFLK